MKRKLKWLAIVLAVSLLGFGTALLLWPRDRITVESWKQIQIGMSEKEVENILGRPGMSVEEWREFNEGHFPSGQTLQLEEQVNADAWKLDGETFKYWTSQRGTMLIGFDARGHVVMKLLWSAPEGPSFLDRLRNWLGW
jgi:hypothetical protein